MTPITTVRPGDIVECDVRGRRFYALVNDRQPRGLDVKPITPGINHFHVTSHQVREIFRKRRPRVTA